MIKKLSIALILICIISCRDDSLEQLGDFDGEYVGEMRYQYFPQSTVASIDCTYIDTISISWNVAHYVLGNDTIHQSELNDSTWSWTECCGAWEGYTFFQSDCLTYYYGDTHMGYDNQYNFKGKKL